MILDSRIFRFLMRNMYRFFCLLATLVNPRYVRVSHSEEGTTKDDDLGFKGTLWWLYKYYYRQVELPEPGKGIAEHFAAQRLDFPLPKDFAAAATARIAAAGDILAHRHVRGDTLKHLWDDTGAWFFDANISCANLESPVAPSQPYSPIPKNLLIPLRMNNSVEVFDACIRNGGGINFFSTANNHALDRGEAGLLETLDFLDQKGVPHTGTARNETERDDIPVLEKQGVRIAFLSYTFALNGLPVPKGKDYLVNMVRLNRADCDLSLIERHIRIAKEEKAADMVIACIHWSLEFESFPTRHIIDRGHRLLETGIDVIIGNHAHGLQGAEQYPFLDPYSGVKKQGLILYALGDLLSWHPALNTRLGCLAKISVQKGAIGGRPVTVVAGVELKPTYLYSEIHQEQCSDYRVMDLEALAQQVEEGRAPLALSRKQKTEILRLRALAGKILPKA